VVFVKIAVNIFVFTAILTRHRVDGHYFSSLPMSR